MKNHILRDTKQHRYKDGTVFEDILSLCRFDRELRLLVFSAIEKVEIALRAQIINEYSVALHNPFWYTDAANFANPKMHAGFLNSLTAYINRSNDVFIKHFYIVLTIIVYLLDTITLVMDDKTSGRKRRVFVIIRYTLYLLFL
jgi:hypothetical protein